MPSLLLCIAMITHGWVPPDTRSLRFDTAEVSGFLLRLGDNWIGIINDKIYRTVGAEHFSNQMCDYLNPQRNLRFGAR